MNIDLDIEREIDAAMAEQTRLSDAEKNLEADEAWRQSGLAANGPANYDYAAAYRDGQSFEQAEGGGINLPNQYIGGVEIAGYDLNTGENYFNTNDPDGFGDRGFNAFRLGYTNTEQGVPNDTVDSVFHLALHHSQNGGTRNTFGIPVSDELKDVAFGAATEVTKIAEIIDQLEQLPDAPMDLPPGEGGTLTAEMLDADSEFQADAKLIYDFWDEKTSLQMDDLTGAEPNYTETGIQEMAMLNANLGKMAELIYRVESGTLPPEVAQAYVRVMEKYDRVDWYNPDVIGGTVAGALTDPAFWGSLGVGSLLFKSGGAQAAKLAMMSKLKQVAMGAATAAGAGAFEGGLYLGSEELTDQAMKKGAGLQGPYDFMQVGREAGFGALGGAIFGTPIGAILSAPGREAIVKGIHKIMENYANIRTPRMGSRESMRGSMSLRPLKPVASYSPEFKDFGELMASTGRATPQFYSRLARESGGAFSKSPKILLSNLQGMAEKGKFPGYELSDTGVVDFLQGKIDAGENVSRRELENFLFARQPQVNALISSPTEFADKGSQSYRQTTIPQLRRAHLSNVLAQNEFNLNPIEIEVDGTPYLAKMNTYLDQIQEYADFQKKLNAMDDEEVFDVTDMLFEPAKPTFPGDLRDANIFFGDDVEQYGRRMLREAMEGRDYAEPRPEWHPITEHKYELVHKETGERRVFEDMGLAQLEARKSVQDLASKMTDDQVIDYLRRNREATLIAPPQWNKPLPDGRTLTITGDAGENYREMRLFLPYEGMTNPHEVAMSRFGKSLDGLNQNERADVDQIVGFARKAPETPYREGVHYPLEQNRLAHIRMQDMYAPDGQKVLFVNEVQSDLKEMMMMPPVGHKGDAKIVDDAVTRLKELVPESRWGQIDELKDFDLSELDFDAEDFGFDYATEPNFTNVQTLLDSLRTGTPKENLGEVRKLIHTIAGEKPTYGAIEHQPMQGSWLQMSMGRILQYARENGYGAVSFPRTVDHVMKVEGWKSQDQISMAVVNTYERAIPNLAKKWQKQQGLKIHKQIPLAGSENGDPLDSFYTLELTEAGKDVKAERPIYGAVVGVGGVEQMYGEEE